MSTWTHAPLALALALVGCGSELKSIDFDGDGKTPEDGDCWDVVAGPEGSGVAGADIHPGAAETWYDGVDQDCDGGSDYDQDLDGHDDVAYGGTDCDDLDALRNPGVAETWYDGVDQDCDDGSDYDQDGDGADGVAYGGEDCDDLDVAFGPAVEEIWYDDIDQNCDGWSDFDVDMDGYESWEYATGADVDCDDADAAVNPAAEEIWYDGADQDCDGASDYDQDGDLYDLDTYGGEDCDDEDATISPEAVEVWYDGVDQDCDAWGDYDQDKDGYISVSYGGDDCDDERFSTNPYASEECNFRDDDCNGYVDEGYSAVDSVTYYLDADEDSYGDASEIELACEDYEPAGYVLNPDDCDDADAETFPGAAESESATECMNDDDADGYGDETASGDVTAGTDCNDANSAISPGDAEITGDEVDSDCNDREVCYVNADADAYRTSSTVTSSDVDCDDAGEAASSVLTTDCDDADADTFPGAAESESSTSCMNDDDADGYGDETVSSGVTAGTDCNDANSGISPGDTEITGDEIDQNCNDQEVCYANADGDAYRTSSTVTSTDVDCDDSGEAASTVSTTDCDDSDAETFPGAAESESSTSCMNDDDADGYGDETVSAGVTAGTDCNDANSAISPGDSEITGDETDSNCDDRETCYANADGDAYRHSSTTVTSTDSDCDDSGEAASSVSSGDCDDSDSDTFPGAAESESSTSCRNDDDADGYGDETVSSGVTAGSDCNDADATVSPGDSETTGDEIDSNCDDKETCYANADADSYRHSSTTVTSSDADCDDAGEAASSVSSGDCDDSDKDTFPGAAESESSTSCMNDDDADGYGDETVSSGVTAGRDCNDADATVSPGDAETTGDEIDSNCDDGEVCYVNADADSYRTTSTVTSSDADCDDAGEAASTVTSGDCDDSDAETFPGAAESESTTSCMNDDDADGYGDETVATGVTAGTDCNDANSAISPGDTEITGDEIDSNCNDQEICYANADGDAYRHSSTTTVSTNVSCDDSGEAASSVTSGDCDDSDAQTFPGAAESESSTSCMNDDDADGYGDDTVGSGVTAGTDCDDADDDISPGDTEITGDEIDSNCDTDEVCYVNLDGDAYRTSSTVTSGDTDCDGLGEAALSVSSGDCDDSDAQTFPGAAALESTTSCRNDDDGDGYGDDTVSGSVIAGGDCDDADTSIYLGAAEQCDAVDSDCDGDVFDFDVDADADGVPDHSSAGMSFAGLTSEDYLSIADDPALDFGTDDFTLEAWIYADTFSGVDGETTDPVDPSVRVLDRTWGSFPSASRWAWELKDISGDGYGELELFGEKGGALKDGTTAANDPFDTGAWTHLAVVVDRSAGTATWYLDGVSVGAENLGSGGSFDDADVSNLSDLYISSPYNTFDGMLDEIRIWSTARTSTEVWTDMCRSTTAGDTDYDDLILYLPFESDYQDAGPNDLTVTLPSGSGATLTSY